MNKSRLSKILHIKLLKYLIENGTDENDTLPDSLILTDAHFRHK